MTTIPQYSSENRNLPPGPNSWQVLHFFTDLNVCNTWKLIASRIGSGWFSSTNSIINIRWYGNCWNSAWRISWSWNNTVATVPRTCQWMTKETFYVLIPAKVSFHNTQGAYHLSKPACLIGLSTNAQRQFCESVRFHPWRAGSVRPKTALSCDDGIDALHLRTAGRLGRPVQTDTNGTHGVTWLFANMAIDKTARQSAPNEDSNPLRGSD